MSQNARHAVTLFQDIGGLTGQHGLLFGVYLIEHRIKAALSHRFLSPGLSDNQLCQQCWRQYSISRDTQNLLCQFCPEASFFQ